MFVVIEESRYFLKSISLFFFIESITIFIIELPTLIDLKEKKVHLMIESLIYVVINILRPNEY